MKVIKIAVTDDADQVIEEFAAQFDMKKQGVASRVYERFGQLPRDVQLWFIGVTSGHESQGMQQFAQMVLGALEHGPRNGTHPPRRELVTRADDLLADLNDGSTVVNS